MSFIPERIESWMCVNTEDESITDIWAVLRGCRLRKIKPLRDRKYVFLRGYYVIREVAKDGKVCYYLEFIWGKMWRTLGCATSEIAFACFDKDPGIEENGILKNVWGTDEFDMVCRGEEP